MAYTPSESFPELVDAMKKGAAALRDAEIPFLLGGGLAAWAYGGPPTDHDVDFLALDEADAERALEALVDVGMRPERPPEGWLLKAWDGDILVDLIFEPAGGPVGDEHFDRAIYLEVAALPLLVASIDDVLATKVLAMSEQDPDYRPGARDRTLAPRADRLGARARPGRGHAVRRGVLHARRAAPDPARAGRRARRIESWPCEQSRSMPPCDVIRRSPTRPRGRR